MSRKLNHIHNHGYFRVAAARPQVHLANPMKNADEHIALMKEMAEQGVQLAVFPEMSLTGYTVEDLLGNEMLHDGVLDALARIRLKTQTQTPHMIVAVGAPLRVGDKLINAAVFMHQGKILAVYPKEHLPNYREFYDARWFTRASQLDVKEMPLLGQTVPVGSDILIKVSGLPEVVIHGEVCEDGWVQIPPSTYAANAGATIVCNLSASNEVINKREYRKSVLVEAGSAQRILIMIYSSIGWGESTKDLVWGGDAYVAENGHVLAQAKLFQRGNSFIVADVRPQTMQMERQRQTTFKDNAASNFKPFRTVLVDSHLGSKLNLPANYHLMRKVSRNPFVSDDPSTRTQRAEQIIEMAAVALAFRLESSGIKKIVVGGSGGLDSTLAILIAIRALAILGLPRTNLIVVTMPGFGTTKRTRSNIERLCLALGVTFKVHSIVPESKLALDDIGHDPTVFDVSFENVQARKRTAHLFDLAGEGPETAIVLGTGDLSEAVLGWCTFNGDHMSLYNVNGGIPKTLVKFLVRWCAEVLFEAEPEVKATLIDILDTVVSPELLPVDAAGESAQTTEDHIGPYVLQDFFAYYHVRYGFKPSHILFLAHQAQGDVYDLPTIRKWLFVFYKRFFGQQYKRDTVPASPKIGSVSVSPRGDLRMPTEAKPTLWLEELYEWDI